MVVVQRVDQCDEAARLGPLLGVELRHVSDDDRVEELRHRQVVGGSQRLSGDVRGSDNVIVSENQNESYAHRHTFIKNLHFYACISKRQHGWKGYTNYTNIWTLYNYRVSSQNVTLIASPAQSAVPSITDPVTEFREAAVGRLTAGTLKLDVPSPHVQQSRPYHVSLPGTEQLKQPPHARVGVLVTLPGRHRQTQTHREAETVRHQRVSVRQTCIQTDRHRYRQRETVR